MVSRGSANTVLVGALLVGIVAAIGAETALDRSPGQVEGSITRYATAMAAQDADAAAAEIAPSRRARWRAFLESQLGNIYELRGLGVRTPSVLARLTTGAAAVPTEATAVLDVNRGYPGFFYQPTTRVPLMLEEGRIYLAAPLLAPESEP